MSRLPYYDRWHSTVQWGRNTHGKLLRIHDNKNIVGLQILIPMKLQILQIQHSSVDVQKHWNLLDLSNHRSNFQRNRKLNTNPGDSWNTSHCIQFTIQLLLLKRAKKKHTPLFTSATNDPIGGLHISATWNIKHLAQWNFQAYSLSLLLKS